MTTGAYTRALALALLVSGLSTQVDAQNAGEFYKNRQMRLIVGHAVGNDYDIGARLLAKYLQKHIPGQPTIIVQNMTAAQSVVAANYVYAQAARDGSVIGTFSRNLPNQALMGQSNIEADLRRFNWLGATSLPGRICAAWHTSPIKSVADLFKQELIVGSSGAGTSNSILPTVANHVLGTKFRIIEGYRGSQDVILAVEQWGGFTLGRTSSFVDHEGSLGDSGMRSLYTGLVDSTTGAAGINQIAYTWQLGNGITLNVGADEPRNGSIQNLSIPLTIGGSGATNSGWTIGADPITSRHGTSHPDPWVSLRMSQAWGRASIAALGHKNAATYYDSRAGAPGYVPPATCVNGTAPGFTSGTTQCNHADDKWGWAVLAGAEIKLDMLSPGSRVGFYGTVGSGATRMSANSQTSPGLFGSGNNVAFGINTDAVYVNGGQLQLTDHYSFGGGFEYFWTRNFSSTIYGGYTRFEYNSTVVNNRLFCGGANGFGGGAQGFTTAGTCDPSYSLWQVGTHHDWFPLPGLRFAVDVLYTRVESDMAGQTVTLTKGGAFNQLIGARPTGAYTVKDLGLVSVMARAQRSWGAD